ncbi:uncharacterized protein LOC111436659 [Cucurbita moschata]|uniref:Uncharacterized protein LOC111436659 n=1 Tax=Cucurbita moschata TaxID=3662 RepID=A0A6J1EQ42_CUCMO|nr:uncharacterized protein LOC111436659 [Cucurbita moschata]
MGGESNFSVVAQPFFDGDNYQMWVVCMEIYLEALDLWEEIEEDYEVPPLLENPSIAQIKDYLKDEYEGDERIRGMKVLNLIRDFELQKMKESESVKEYSDRLLNIANKVRLLGSVLNDSGIVEKVLVTVPKKFEATITTLENTKDLSKISLTELLNALQAQEQRRSMRQEGVIEGALPAKHQDNSRYKNKKFFKNQSTNGDSSTNYQKTKGGGFKKLLSTIVRRKVCCISIIGQGNHREDIVDRRDDLQHLLHDFCLVDAATECGDAASSSRSGVCLVERDANISGGTDRNMAANASRSSRVCQLLDKDYKVLFEKKQCLIKDGSGKDLFNVKMKGKSFALNLMEKEQMTFISIASATEIWHKRLGHFQYRCLLQMQ